MRSNSQFLKNLDWLSILFFFLLVLMGWGNIYSAVYNEEFSSIFSFTQRYGKQLIWILTAIVLIILIFLFDVNLYQSLAYPVFGISMVSLVLVLLIGTEISGARSWFSFGGFGIQPSEFAKFTTALAFAKLVHTKNGNLTRLGGQLRALLLIVIPAALILLQPDAGSALVYSAFILVMYREGLPAIYLFTLLGLGLLFILSLLIDSIILTVCVGILAAIVILLTRHIRHFYLQVIAVFVLCAGFIQSVDYTFYNILEDRHRNRINILLGKAHDPQGIGYNTNQSMIAIGSGGWSGKGYLQGTQTKYDFVPEQSTDFIFCTVGEEWGFWGSSILVLLYILFFFRLVQIAERQKSPFSRTYGYCVVAILFFHFAVNIAMTIGLAPVIGIPLPFFSYGGSSLWGFTLLLFIFLKLDAHRKEIL